MRKSVNRGKPLTPEQSRLSGFHCIGKNQHADSEYGIYIFLYEYFVVQIKSGDLLPNVIVGKPAMLNSKMIFPNASDVYMSRKVNRFDK